MDKNCDLIIDTKWLITNNPTLTILENYALIIKSGIIIDIVESKFAQGLYHTNNHLNRTNHVIIPPFINSHCHSSMSLFRGYGGDINLEKWLNDYIWKAEAKFVDPEFIRLGSTLAIAEMIKSGTSCFFDMYFHPEETIKIVKEAGIRAAIGISCDKGLSLQNSKITNNKTLSIKERIDYIEGIYQEYVHYSPQISLLLDPHAPYTVTHEYLQEIISLSHKYNLPISTHIHETQKEIDNYLKKHGKRPIAHMHEYGLLNDKLIAVHMVHLLDEEIELLASQQVNIVHCPESNMKLSSGIADINKLYQHGINVTIGTDGASSNNDLDMLSETKSAVLLAKIKSMSHTQQLQTPIEDIFQMATFNGAKAIGLENKIGSIEIGKSADLAIIDFNHLNTMPCYDILSNLVYAANNSQFTDLLIAGNIIMQNRKLLTIDEDALKSEVQDYQKFFLTNI